MSVWEAEYSIRRKDGEPITETVVFENGGEKVTLTRTGETYLISPLEVLPGDPHFDIEVIQRNEPYKGLKDRTKIHNFVGNSAFERNIRNGSFALEPENEELRKLLTEEDESVWNSDWEYEEPYPVGEIVLELTEEGGEGIGFSSDMAWAIYFAQLSADKQSTDFKYYYRANIGYHLLDVWHSHNGGGKITRRPIDDDDDYESIGYQFCTRDGEIMPLQALRHYGKETLDKFYEVYLKAHKELDGFLEDITDGIEAMYEELTGIPNSSLARGEINKDEYDKITERYELQVRRRLKRK